MKRVCIFIAIAAIIAVGIYVGYTHYLYAPAPEVPGNPDTGTEIDPKNWLKKDIAENRVRFEYPPNYFGEIVPYFHSDLPVPITTTNTMEKILFEKTVFDGSGMNPTSIDQFKVEKLGNETFYTIQTGRFEGQISYSAYVVKNAKVYPFHFAWMVGADWMSPEYDVTKDENLAVFKKILSSVEIY